MASRGGGGAVVKGGTAGRGTSSVQQGSEKEKKEVRENDGYKTTQEQAQPSLQVNGRERTERC